MEVTKKELDEALGAQYNALPFASVLVNRQTGIIRFCNAICRALLPNLKPNLRWSRYFPNGDFPDEKSFCLRELCGETFLIVSDEVCAGDTVFLLYILQRENLLFAREFSESLLSYARDLTFLPAQFSNYLAEAPDPRRSRYGKMLSKSTDSLRERGAVLQAALSGMRQLKPGGVLACSCSKYLQLLCRDLSPALNLWGITLETDCPAGVTVLINPRDFGYALANLLNFAFTFARAQTLKLVVTPDEEREDAVFSLFIPDRYGILDLYRTLARGHYSEQEQNKHAEGLFYPLGVALHILRSYRCEASVLQLEKQLEIRLRVPTTFALPELVIRQGEELDYELREFLQALSHPQMQGFFRKMLDEVPAVQSEPVFLPLPRKAELF